MKRNLLLRAGLLLSATHLARAQAPAWNGATPGSATPVAGTSFVNGTAADAVGNVYVTGSFTGTVAFGGTTLTSAGSFDLFVAKYVPRTGTWAWAQSGGGTGADEGRGIALSGTSVYVTGYFNNDAGNAKAVGFGGTSPATSTLLVRGASAQASSDLLVAKYTDNGSSAALGWMQVGGGTGPDGGEGIAVSGSRVYVTGGFYNDAANARAVVYGGDGTTPGTQPVSGASPRYSEDQLLVKYVDNGSSATLGWTQVGGGTDTDLGLAVAVSADQVYVTGSLTNDQSNKHQVLFGGSGTTPGTRPVSGASAGISSDLLLTKYTDQGATASYGWSQVAGGLNTDQGRAVAVSGSSVYVAGSIANNRSNLMAVVFGGDGTTPGTSPQYGVSNSLAGDIVLAKFTDQGATGVFVWSQVGGGAGSDQSTGLAVSGSSLYLTGYLYNSAGDAASVVFGGSGPTPGTRPQPGASSNATNDLLLVKYTDQGPTGSYAWSQVGGGLDNDFGYGVALSGQQVYVGGYAIPAATFGPTTLTGPSGQQQGILACVTDATLLPLPTRAVSSTPALSIYPSPTTGLATLTGAAPGAEVQVLDCPGRLVLAARADASGTASLVLPAHLAPGLYVVRSGARAQYLVVR